jgi:beta-N-acetylglucosaminidase
MTTTDETAQVLDAPRKWSDADHHLLTGVTVRKQYFDDCSQPTFWRMRQDPDFPKPVMIRSRPYWRRGDIVDFIDRRARQAA